MLDVFYAWSEGIINAEDVANILECIESFVFRRLICNVPTNALNKIFATLGRNIRRINTHKTEYVAIFKYLISAGAATTRYPSDEEFKEELTKRDIYNLKSKNRIHLYERLENYNNREKVDVEKLIEAKKEGLTFEHIMPQNLSSKWKEELGDRVAQIHEKYLHTLGNITLTAYNSELTNKLFLEKLTKENGFKDSRLWLNQSLQHLTAWGETEIKDRATLLAERAVKIWAFPQTRYQPSQKFEAQLGLYDEYNFTGTKPKSFSFLEEDHQVNSWRELFQKSIKLLHALDSVAFEQVLREPDSKKYLASNPQLLREAWKLAEDIYLEINLSTDGIISALRYFFDAYNIDESDFSVVLREDTAKKLSA